MVKADEFLKETYETIKGYIKAYDVYVKGEDGVNNIVIFDEPELVEGKKSRYRIGYSKLIIFDNENPILAVETISSNPTPPKDIAGPIPIYMVARKIVINKKNGPRIEYDLEGKDLKLQLLIVVPDQENSQKSAQISDLNEKFKGVLNLKSEHSNLKDFEICEFSNLKNILGKLFKK